MTQPPASPKIYHITHVDNLPAIIGEGALICDREIVDRGEPVETIGMSEIKRRRIEMLEVTCHPGTKVGDYVPFYFCPRSVMLFVIHCANHPELTYRGGQGPIVHLEADLHEVIDWTTVNGVDWAYSLSNAGAYYTEFRSAKNQLDELDWEAILSTDFRSATVKEAKQAEFLIRSRFPFELVQRIGVRSASVQARVANVLQSGSHQPLVVVRPAWYY